MKRILTILFILIAIAGIGYTIYAFPATQEQYVMQKEYDEWLTKMYGPGSKSNEYMQIIIQRYAGIASAVLSAILAVLINVMKRSKKQSAVSEEESAK